MSKQDKIFFIYKYEWPTGEIYIGQTFHGSHRFGNICSYSTSFRVYRQMKKHPDFTKEIVEDNLTEENVDEKEKFYIEKFNSFSDNNPKGLNLTVGGHYQHYRSKETRQKIAEANSRRIWTPEMRLKRSQISKGKYPTEETKRKMSEALKGHQVTDATRAILREKNLGSNNPMYGKHISETARQALSKRWSGAGNPKYGKPLDEKTRAILSACREKRKKSVDVYDIQGNYLQTFPNMLAAANALNVKQGTISCQCSRKSRKSKCGFIFRLHGEQF